VAGGGDDDASAGLHCIDRTLTGCRMTSAPTEHGAAAAFVVEEELGGGGWGCVAEAAEPGALPLSATLSALFPDTAGFPPVALACFCGCCCCGCGHQMVTRCCEEVFSEAFAAVAQGCSVSRPAAART
jgi:hypothetical protein